MNHAFLGNHRGGSTPFYLELTGGLRAENLLQICVNNTRALDRVPMRNTDWFNYGGIYRDVELFRLPPTFIREFKAQLVPDGTYGRIKFEMAVDGPDLKARPGWRSRNCGSRPACGSRAAGGS